MELVPGRACGGCTACCKHLTIEEADFKKPAGFLCKHCVETVGCAIYQGRPPVCQAWYCGWRRLGWLSDALRPDRSAVLIRFTDEVPAQFAVKLGVIFEALGGCNSILANEVIKAISALVAAQVAAFLLVPGLPGYIGTRVLLNELLAAPVRGRHRDAVARVLIGAFIHAALQPKVLIPLDTLSDRVERNHRAAADDRLRSGNSG
jgi:hypothetical protein